MYKFERLVNDTTIVLEMTNSVSRNEGLTLEIIPVSDCCGEYMRGLDDWGICPRCGEHCEIVNS
jgi:hypothetical protein